MPKVYTRRGDDGTTRLLFAGGRRVPKDDLRVRAYGQGDEVVAVLGLARAEAEAEGQGELAGVILRLQRELFVLNAELATPPRHWGRLEAGVSLVTAEMVSGLEALIDEHTARFEQPRDFVVPGSSRLGALLDLACRVARRAERDAVALARRGRVRPEALAYLNRLSDALWVLARYAERGRAQPRPREG